MLLSHAYFRVWWVRRHVDVMCTVYSLLCHRTRTATHNILSHLSQVLVCLTATPRRHPTLAHTAPASPPVCPHAVNRTRATQWTLTHGARANVHPCSQRVVALRAWSVMAAPRMCLHRARIMRPSPLVSSRGKASVRPPSNTTAYTPPAPSRSQHHARAQGLSRARSLSLRSSRTRESRTYLGQELALASRALTA